MNKKSNKHYKKTDIKIRNLVLELLLEKPIKKITVTEICQQIGINRSTFYEHFYNVYEVLEQTEYEMAEEMGKRFFAKLTCSRRDAFLEIFRFVYENRWFYSVFILQGNTIHFIEEISFEKLFENNSPLIQKLTFLSEIDYYYHIEYFRSGMNALLRCWMERDCKETPEKLLSILVQEYQMFRIIDAE